MSNFLLDTLLNLWTEPKAFWLILVLPGVVVLFLIARRQRRLALAIFGSLPLVARMTSGVSDTRRWIKLALLCAVLLFGIVAMARPQWGSRLQLTRKEGVDIAVCVDVSMSMLAQDIRPSRLDWARRGVAELLDRLDGDRITLIPFTRTARILYPLTLDYGAVRTLLPNLGPGLFSAEEQGTSLGRAIETATRTFDQQDRKYKVIILMSDGEDQSRTDIHTRTTDPIEAAKKAAEQGVVIYTVGIASPEGELIPNEDNSGRRFLRDTEGSVVKTRLDEETLRRIALETGGAYYRTTLAQDELTEIYEEVASMEKKEQQSREKTHREERYTWPLAIAVALLIAEMLVPERRRFRPRQAGSVDP